MTKMTGILLGVAAAACFGSTQVSAQSSPVGTWMLEKAENYGAAPQGVLMLDSDGHFSAMLLKADLPKLASGRRTQGTPEEYRAIAEGSLAYFGTYKTEGDELVFHIVASTFPNWNGTDQRRTNLNVAADKLQYTNPRPSSGGAPDTVVWRRVEK